MRTIALILPLCFMHLIFVSCSGASGPVTPSDNPSQEPDPVAESDFLQQNDTVNNRGIFGAWKVNIDIETLTTQITPAQNSVTREAMAIGDIFDADLSQFLTVSPCSNCLSIPYVNLAPDDNLLVGIRMKHPFSNIAARPDLHGFDVRAIFISDTEYSYMHGIDVMKPDGSIVPAIIPYYFLLNSDGLTSHYDEIPRDERYFMNGQIDSININGFLRFFEKYATDPFDPHNPDGHNVMPVGSAVSTREAVISYDDIYEALEFYIVADVAYGQSAVFTNRTDPQYYLPAFNRTEAWRIEYWIENNNLTHGDPSSTADIVVQVFDWQHGAMVDPAYPDPMNLTGIRESSNVAQVEILLANLQDDLLISTTPESGSGTPQDPLQYRLTVTNVNDTSFNQLPGLIAVRDELYGSASPSGRMPIPETPAGFPYETLDILDYALYHPIWVNVPNDNGNRPHDNELYVVEKSQYAETGYAQVKADFFMDESHKKFQYRWDYDYDGVTFDLDGEGLPQEYEIFTEGGKRDFGLRVRTNSKPPREYIYTIPVYVEGPPVKGNLEGGGDWIASSGMRSNSIAMTDDNVYIASLNGSGLKWNIQLSIGDKSGNFTTHLVTDSVSFDFKNPSLVVIDDGINDGVYVAFAGHDGSNWGIFFNKGNLDGTGFSNSNIKTVKAPAMMTIYDYPTLLTDSGNLYIYLYYFQTGNSYIYPAHSEDLGDTWTNENTIDPTGDRHGRPSAVLASTSLDKAIYVVWQDRRNFSERGNDLYIARSTDGMNFGTSVNISTAVGVVHELSPEISTYNEQLAIAYQQDATGSSTYIYVKLMDLYYQSITDLRIARVSGEIHTQPAIGIAADGTFTLAYGRYDLITNVLTGVVETYTSGGAFGQYFINTIVEESLGNIAPSGMEIYPAVICNRVAGGHAVESFAIWKTYSGGSFESLSPESMFFGNVDSAYYITMGDMNY